MNALLAKIQQQPDRVKRRVAFFSSLLISALIFTVWFTSIHGSLAVDSGAGSGADLSAGAAVSDSVSALGDALVRPENSPLSTMGTTISDGFKTIKTQFEELTKLFK